ncbi:hypothetical protein SEUCBS139899_001250 [Sporothrix eucalyptigena]|uniref:Glutaredoxin domain-containing protein n=1 Tax=Sporothrix eucalyptigena TaxID=1812306 RepID=A0ABP0BTG7_9PEZI
MPRRLKLTVIAALAFTIAMMLYTSRLRDTHTPDQRTIQDFYHKTKGALGSDPGAAGGVAQAKAPVVVDMDNDGDVDEEDARLAREMQSRLKAAEQQAKDNANAKAPNPPDAPSNVIGVGSSASGQKGAAAAGGAVVGAAAGAAAPAAGAADATPQTDEAKAVEAELDKIFKRSPVIIFSKTYCPFSKRAKGLLLDKYVIDPAPFVVELDTHPLGPALQARLAELTGRRTVPNIIVGGKSIGGGDDIAALDTNKQLVEKITALGGGRGALVMKERLA